MTQNFEEILKLGWRGGAQTGYAYTLVGVWCHTKLWPLSLSLSFSLSPSLAHTDWVQVNDGQVYDKQDFPSKYPDEFQPSSPDEEV